MTIVTPFRQPVRPSLEPPPHAPMADEVDADLSWQQAIRRAVRDPAQLCRILRLPADVEAAAIRATRDFPLFAPRGYIQRMRPGDPNDPLLRQVLPLAAELTDRPGDHHDPVGDGAASLRPGLLQKYEQRVLLVTTGACAVHCRYCFRRHFPYQQVPNSPVAWQPAIDQIAADASIREVILSGGDPLTLVDDQLAELVNRLTKIPHLRRLRIHTRLPIVIPQRVTAGLLSAITPSRLTPIMVIHANHAAELDRHVAAALAELATAGILLLNQAVLLRGVNDSLDSLVQLSERLVDLRVVPYYLHQLDRVTGAAHFEVPVEQGKQLIAGLRASLPGYAVPRYVQEIPGQPNKTVLA